MLPQVSHESVTSLTHDDLWFAVRGAGSSMAIVTDLAFRAFAGSEPGYWGVQIAHESINGTNAFIPILRMLRAMPTDWAATIMLACHPGATAGDVHALPLPLQLPLLLQLPLQLPPQCACR
jgi:hypothetical protein